MTNSILELKRPVRRKLQKIAQYNREADYRRRAKAILLLHNGYSQTDVSQILHASRTSIRKWVKLLNDFGESGLVPEQKGRYAYAVTESMSLRLMELIQMQPKEFGWFASRWSSELLVRQINDEYSTEVHSSTIRRLLPKLGIVWNRASPTLCIQDKEKARKMKAINKALANTNAENPVFYVDEADVDLNPRIGSCWSVKRKKTRIPTPAKNQKNYLAGALNAQTGQVVWVEGIIKGQYYFIIYRSHCIA